MDGFSEDYNKIHQHSSELPQFERSSLISTSPNRLQRDALFQLYEFSKPEHKTLIISTATLIVTSFVQLCIPASTGRIIDGALASSFSESVKSDSSSIPTQLSGLFVIMGLSAVLTYFRNVWQVRSGNRFTARLRNRVYASILLQDFAFFDTTPLGDLLSRLSSDTDCVQVAITSQMMSLMRSSVMSFGAIILLLHTSFSLALLSLTVLPPTVIIAKRAGMKMKTSNQNVRKLHGDATSKAEEALVNIQTVQQFTAEVHEADMYRVRVEAAHDAAAETARMQAQSKAMIELLVNGSMLCVLGYGATLVTNKTLSPGSLAGFVMYSLIMAGNISGLSGIYVDLMKALGAFDRLLEIMNKLPSISARLELQNDVKSVSQRHSNFSKSPMIANQLSLEVSFKSVAFSYPSRPSVQILNGFNLEIPHGQVCALVGSSGAGKSTIASLLTRLYDINAGSITLNGVPIHDWTAFDVRKSIGVVMQEPLLFPTTIKDNIRYGNFNATHDEIMDVARQAFVWEFAKNLPKGLDTIVGARGTQLSGGQKQRVAVARCMLKNPSLVILDEATSALDSESEFAVQKAMDAACRGRTVLLIAHRLSSIKNADRIAVLEDGRLAEVGTYNELVMKPNGAFRKLVERQIK